MLIDRHLSVKAAWRIGVAVSLALFVAACSDDRIEVERETTLSSANSGSTFAVVPMKDQDGDPSFSGYALAASDRLMTSGYLPAAAGTSPRYAVMIAYPAFRTEDDQTASEPGNAGGHHHSGMGGGMGGGGIGGGGMGHGMGGYGGGRGPDGDASASGGGSAAHAAHQRVVTVSIYDLSRPGQASERVFRAKVHSPAQAGNTSLSVPDLIDAAFLRFPGPERDTYSVPVDHAK